ncbi:MAG: arsenic efflux protein [Clostridiales bacterium]|nr:arsenic efflux protein [Clostridiales bacterium]
MGEVFLDAFIDTLWVLPFLLIMNFIIELVEYRSKGLKANKALKGGLAPLIGSGVGILPQCGFSVVATELYSKRRIALGTLLAVYIATSDEALPIMLSSYDGLKKVWPVIVIKVCFALIVGYSTFLIEKLVSKRKSTQPITEEANAEHSHDHDHEHEHEHSDENEGEVHIHGCHHHSLDEEETKLDETATRKQKFARVWKLYLKHPLLHTATVILYIFIVNILFGITVYYVGEDRLAQFIGSTGYLQPILSGLVGLIPNCAASVVITELYVVGGLNLGGAVAGLCVSAGIGYAVLVKQNRPIKNTILVIALMYVLSVGLGMVVNVIV